MKIEKTIDSIEKLIESLSHQDIVERLNTYSTIKMLLVMLDDYAKEHYKNSDIHMYINEFNMPLECIVGLDDFGKDESQYHVWLMTGVSKLRSQLGFNVS